MRKRYTEEQIAYAMLQAEAGATAPEICRKMGISEQTFYRWKRQYAGLGVCGGYREKSHDHDREHDPFSHPGIPPFQ